MSKVEVLVACMHQKDDNLYREMNLQTDAILANQGDEFFYKEYKQENGCVAKLISTADRGVGKNRNKALNFATGEYLLCSDQDMIYSDNYPNIVEEAFKKRPNADIVVFSLNYLNRFSKGKKEGKKIKRVHLFNCLRYGTARVAIKKGTVEKYALSFSTLYGGGAKFSCGEDSLFLVDALKRGAKMYYFPIDIATVKQEESSWFKGFTEKYFIDKGILIANAFPKLKKLLVYYYSFRLRKVTKEFGFVKILKFMKQGLKTYKNY